MEEGRMDGWKEVNGVRKKEVRMDGRRKESCKEKTKKNGSVPRTKLSCGFAISFRKLQHDVY